MWRGQRELWGGDVLPWRRVWNHGRLRFHVNKHACALPGVFTPAKDLDMHTHKHTYTNTDTRKRIHKCLLVLLTQ